MESPLRNVFVEEAPLVASLRFVADVVRVWRLEFPQSPGYRFAWLGPYTSHWMTAVGEELIRYMDAEHSATRPHPADMELFAKHRAANDPLLCGCASEAELRAWFGPYLPALLAEGAHTAVYDVPRAAIVELSDQQIIFIQRRATLVSRTGTPATSPLVRSSAGSRAAIRAESKGKYDYVGQPGPPLHLLRGVDALPLRSTIGGQPPSL
jgi:hypothetical protein